MTIEPRPSVGATATRRPDTKPPAPVENLKPPLNPATRRRRSDPITAGPHRQPEPPGSTEPACSTNFTRSWSNDSSPTPEAELAIQTAVWPRTRTAGTKCAGGKPSAAGSSFGYGGGTGFGGGAGTGTVAEPVALVEAPPAGPEAEAGVAWPPPPQPASVSAAAIATAGPASRLTCRLVRATAPM